MNAIILSGGRGDYVTGIKWQPDGHAEIMGGSQADAIRYTEREAAEVVTALECSNGGEYTVELL